MCHSKEVTVTVTAGGGGAFTFWMVEKYFIYLVISITYRNNLYYILLK